MPGSWQLCSRYLCIRHAIVMILYICLNGKNSRQCYQYYHVSWRDGIYMSVHFTLVLWCNYFVFEVDLFCRWICVKMYATKALSLWCESAHDNSRPKQRLHWLAKGTFIITSSPESFKNYKTRVETSCVMSIMTICFYPGHIVLQL